MKRIISFILSFVLLLGTFSPVYGEVALGKEIKLLENDNYIYCPIKEVAEEFDYELEWNGDSESIKLGKNENIYEFKNNKNFIIINDKKIITSSKPIVKNGIFYLSLEMLSKLPELIVSYDGEGLNIRYVKENREDFFEKSDEEDTYERLNNYLTEIEEGRGFSGSVLIAKKDKVLLNESYGYANQNQKISNHRQGKFYIGSMTKQFTALSIMQLKEKGLISLDDKLSKYYPEIKNGDKISIHHMLIHSSGLTNYTSQEEFFSLDYENITDKDLIDMFKDLDLEFEPGEFYNYSNTNYFLLGKIIEKASGKSYEEYVEENIFKPLNMQDSGTYSEDMKEKVDTLPYTGYLELDDIDDIIVVKLIGAAGNIYSTTEDLYRWDRALKTDKLVSKESLDKMFEVNEMKVFGTGSPITMGYGWFLDSIDGQSKFAEHGGNTLGYTSQIIRDMDLDESQIVLSNIGYYNVGQILEDIYSILNTEKPIKVKKHREIKMDNYDVYDDYIGEYKLDEGIILSISRDENKLYAQLIGQEKFEIYPMDKEDFFAKIVDLEIKFNRKNEIVDSLVLNQLGISLIGEKMD